MAKKIGLNVALGLNTTGFKAGLDKSKQDMRRFAQDVKRQNEFASKLGLAGFGRGFGIAGGALEAMSMGGVGAATASVALPVAALAATITFMENINQFRRDAVKHMEKFNQDMAAGKVGQLVTDQMSAFAALAAQQGAVAGPGVFETFMQGFASGQGGQNFLLGAKGAAGGLSQLLNFGMENPLESILSLLAPGLGFGQGAGQRVMAGVDVGMAQNTAQAQHASESLELARKQTTLLDRLLQFLGAS